MATVNQTYNRMSQTRKQCIFTVAIDTSGFLDTETINGGRLSPCVAARLCDSTNYTCTITISFKRCIEIQR